MWLGSDVVGESVNVALMFHYIGPDASLAALTMKINVLKKWKTVGTRQDRCDPSDPCGACNTRVTKTVCTHCCNSLWIIVSAK
jgi:hypothetical protein